MHFVRKLKQNKGVVLILSLGIMLAMLTLGVGYASRLRMELKVAQNELDSLKALYLAEAGVEHSIADLMMGGGGDVGAGNLVGSLGTDYIADYEPSTGLIMVNTYGLDYTGASKKIEVQFSPLTGAMQAGENISIAAPAGGTIVGNLDARGTISPNINLYNTTGYTITANNTGIIPPVPKITGASNSYESIADYTYTDCTTLGFSPPDGVHFVNGDCSISGGGPFTLNGTLVVTGDLTMTSIGTSFTITPSGNNPAVIVGGNITGTAMNFVTFNGLVYAGNNISFTTFAFTTVVNGALVAGNRLSITNVPTAIITFDSSMNPPYFFAQAGGQTRLSSWKGHF